MNNTLKNGLVMLLTLGSTVYASFCIQAGQSNLHLWLLMAVVGIVVIRQLRPGLSHFINIVRGLFAGQDKAA